MPSATYQSCLRMCVIDMSERVMSAHARCSSERADRHSGNAVGRTWWADAGQDAGERYDDGRCVTQMFQCLGLTHPYEILNLDLAPSGLECESSLPKPITAVKPTRWCCAKRCYGIVDLRPSSARAIGLVLASLPRWSSGMLQCHGRRETPSQVPVPRLLGSLRFARELRSTPRRRPNRSLILRIVDNRPFPASATSRY